MSLGDRPSPDPMPAADPPPEASATPVGGLGTAAESFWQHKPWWCQPWSILSTGLLAMAASWWLLHIWWISVPVALLVLAWWIGRAHV